jgi:ribonuclease E
VQPAANVEADEGEAVKAEPAAETVTRVEEPAGQPAPVAAGNGNAAREVSESPPSETADREPATRRHETGSSEPRLERVVVRPDQNGDAIEAPPAPQRKGWWQRKFGGE